MNQIIGNILAGLLVAAAIVFVGTQAIESYNKHQAYATCAASSRYTTKDASGAEVSYPVEELYTTCLQNFGY